MLRVFALDLRGFFLVSPAFVYNPALKPFLKRWLEFEGCLSLRHFCAYAHAYDQWLLSSYARELQEIINVLILENTAGTDSRATPEKDYVTLVLSSAYFHEESFTVRLFTDKQLLALSDSLQHGEETRR
jgi:hypothetical protein